MTVTGDQIVWFGIGGIERRLLKGYVLKATHHHITKTQNRYVIMWREYEIQSNRWPDEKPQYLII